MNRREALGLTAAGVLGSLASGGAVATPRAERADEPGSEEPAPITMFLCGDVMTGRGIDQVLPHWCDPRLHERFVRDARDYVRLAERAGGAPIERPVDFAYIWGDALDELARTRPDARLINLETAVTSAGHAWANKGINYRMHPGNVPCLTAAGIDVCALANNHVLDWGYAGLEETLDTLARAGLRSVGAGRDHSQAEIPAIIDVAGKGRVIVFSFGTTSSGIPPAWAAGEDRGGVDLLDDLSPATVRRIAARVQAVKCARDLVVASVHWGGNWGYAIPREQRAFAHVLVESAGVDVVHGHSSHHPKGIEVHRGKLILYGCGDFINDYEGIDGHERFRGELGLMYFASVAPATGRLVRLRLVPTRMRRFQVRLAAPADAQWQLGVLNREGESLGTRIVASPDGAFALRWSKL